MALLTTQQATLAGVTPSYGAVAASDTITAEAGLILHVKNAGGSNDIVTITDPGLTAAGSSATNPTVTVVLTSGEKLIALPFALRSPSTGLITVSHSFTTSVTCAVIKGLTS